MASQSNANHVKQNYIGRRPTRKIHPISANWTVTKSNISRDNGTELILKEKPETGVKTKPIVKTKIESGKVPDLSSRKLRERLVHLLAFNSYTRKEINLILQSEGLRTFERTIITNVLKDIAQLSQNVYNLRLNIWSEVDENWPYYNEEELEQLKKRKKESLREPYSSVELTPASSESQLSTHSTSPPQLADNNTPSDNTSKRPNVDNDEPQPTKKRRINHTTIDNCAETLRTTSQPPSTKISANTIINTIEPQSFDFSDFTEISNIEQRWQYKTAFERYYEEYMPLFQQIAELRRSFRELGAQINNMSKDSPDYEHINKRIVATYYVINSEDELRRQQRCDYLHAKVTHIKQLITRFESKRTKEVVMAYARAIAKECGLRQEPLKATTDLEEVMEATKLYEVPITKEGGATTTRSEEISPTKQEYITDILVNELTLSDSD